MDFSRLGSFSELSLWSQFSPQIGVIFLGYSMECNFSLFIWPVKMSTKPPPFKRDTHYSVVSHILRFLLFWFKPYLLLHTPYILLLTLLTALLLHVAKQCDFHPSPLPLPLIIDSPSKHTSKTGISARV